MQAADLPWPPFAVKGIIVALILITAVRATAVAIE
jgi:hypothetical protein